MKVDRALHRGHALGEAGIGLGIRIQHRRPPARQQGLEQAQLGGPVDAHGAVVMQDAHKVAGGVVAAPALIVLGLHHHTTARGDVPTGMVSMILPAMVQALPRLMSMATMNRHELR